MQLYPAIDLLDGRVVRLLKGDFDAVTDYGGDPGAIAASYAAGGADWLHAVDLSGARDGASRQTGTVRSLANSGLKIQVGGGVRTRAEIDELFSAGARRVIVGSVAITDPATMSVWLQDYGPHRLVAAFDVKLEAGMIWPTISGWTRLGPEPLATLMERYAGAGLEHVLVTDVSRDGALEGPNTDLYAQLSELWPDIKWQASGGVSSLDDLKGLARTGVDGAIVGKALLENRFTLAEALSCLRSA